MCAALTDERDARHLSLGGFGAPGVDLLRAASVLVIGVGGTGCAAASALAAAGIGQLVISDFDRVYASNLARQTLFAPGDVGETKVSVVARRLQEQNPALSIETIDARLSGDALAARVTAASVVLDCTDNFASRFALNTACVNAGRALVSGSAIRWEGQLGVFGPDYATGPCYQCVYSENDESLDDCQGAGVLASLPATIGTMMASEAIKLLTAIGQPARFSIYDAHSGDWRQLETPKNPACSVCARNHGDKT